MNPNEFVGKCWEYGNEATFKNPWVGCRRNAMHDALWGKPGLETWVAKKKPREMCRAGRSQEGGTPAPRAHLPPHHAHIHMCCKSGRYLTAKFKLMSGSSSPHSGLLPCCLISCSVFICTGPNDPAPPILLFFFLNITRTTSVTYSADIYSLNAHWSFVGPGVKWRAETDTVTPSFTGVLCLSISVLTALAQHMSVPIMSHGHPPAFSLPSSPLPSPHDLMYDYD